MSWDVLLQKFPENAVRPEEVPDDYLPPTVGSRAEVVAALRKLLRKVELAGDSFVTIDRAQFAIEIELGDDESCSQLLLHVHEDHAEATHTILRIADHFGMRAIDCSSAEFLVAGPARPAGRRGPQKKPGSRPEPEKHADSPPPPPLTDLPGVVVTQPCVRYVYLSLLAGESPKQQQKAVYRHWIDLARKLGDLEPGILGPSYVLTLPDGQPLGDFRVARIPQKLQKLKRK